MRDRERQPHEFSDLARARNTQLSKPGTPDDLEDRGMIYIGGTMDVVRSYQRLSLFNLSANTQRCLSELTTMTQKHGNSMRIADPTRQDAVSNQGIFIPSLSRNSVPTE